MNLYKFHHELFSFNLVSMTNVEIALGAYCSFKKCGNK